MWRRFWFRYLVELFKCVENIVNNGNLLLNRFSDVCKDVEDFSYCIWTLSDKKVSALNLK